MTSVHPDARRPLWAAAGVPAGVGLTTALFCLQQYLAAAIVIVVTAAALWVADSGLKRERGGTVSDGAAVNHRMLATAIWFVPLAAVALLLDRYVRTWWMALAVGALLGLCYWLSTRWEDAYQAKRLAAGDYRSWDAS